jgi:hypothetical protein
MKRLTIIGAALVLAVLAVLAGRVAAQEVNTLERTFLTFSGTVEMPGVTLQPGTYVFKLADTASRNVVQVWDGEEKNMLGHWLFVQAERPEVTGENVIMFKEQRAGATPAVQYWYFPGERIGKEFLYPKDQATRIAQRTGADVRTEDGVVEGDGLASVEPSSAGVSVQAESTIKNAPAAAQPTASAGSLAGNRGVQTETKAEVDVDADRPEVSAQASVAEPAPAAEPSPSAVGTSGQAELPQTASPLALSGLIGLLSLAGAMTLRSIR